MIKVINDMMTFDSGYLLSPPIRCGVFGTDIRCNATRFTKREFVVTTSEMYPQDIKFEVCAHLRGVRFSTDVGAGGSR